jgi:hypothetical protein
MENPILLISSDPKFRLQIQRALAEEDRVIRWHAGSFSPRDKVASNQWVVLDCRDKAGDAVVAELASIRDYVGPNSRCVVVTSGPLRAYVELIASIGSRATEVTLADSDSVADVLRALFNDSTETIAAAIALSSLLKYLPTAAHDIARCVLAGGLQASSVKEVASAMQRDRSELGRGLRTACGWTATELVDLAKASYAAALLCQPSVHMQAVVTATRFGERRWLDALLRRVFGATARVLRAEYDDSEPGAWLDELLSARRSHRAGKY